MPVMMSAGDRLDKRYCFAGDGPSNHESVDDRRGPQRPQNLYELAIRVAARGVDLGMVFSPDELSDLQIFPMAAANVGLI
jgi:hypothetical protein